MFLRAVMLSSVPRVTRMRLSRWTTVAAAALLGAARVHAQAPANEAPEANPARPTVSTPATLTPVGYLQFENGVLFARDSPEFAHQLSVNQVTKLTVEPRLQLLAQFEPLASTNGVARDAQPGTQPGGIAAGLQVVVLPGEGRKPTVSMSYFRTLYGGSAPDFDIGSFKRSAVFLFSEDLGGFHFDVNGIFSEQSGSNVRRGQFGQTLSISHPAGRLTVAGELWHFTQPLTNGNAVGNLWALSCAVRKNLVVDAGFDHGLTSSSTLWEGFAGFTYVLPHRLWKTGK